jgi:8-oxo-dGTP pyrophosphatase MutT (NUDIX family)
MPWTRVPTTALRRGAGCRVASCPVDLKPFDEYARSLYKIRTAAGALFRDSQNRVLLVRPSYKPVWEIPGGSGEPDEAPWTTAAREVKEEVGLDRPLGRLLVIDHVPGDGVMAEGLAFIFDGGLVREDEVSAWDLKDPEILSVGLFSLAAVREKVADVLVGRITAALGVVDGLDVALCEAGVRVV